MSIRCIGFEKCVLRRGLRVFPCFKGIAVEFPSTICALLYSVQCLFLLVLPLRPAAVKVIINSLIEGFRASGENTSKGFLYYSKSC